MVLRSIFTSSFALLLGLVLWSQAGFNPTEDYRPGPLEPRGEEEGKPSPGTKDNPMARYQWEFERLKSPRTGDIPKNIRARELAFARSLPSRESMIARKLSSTQSIDWQFRGPDNLGGRTRALAVDISNENVIIAGGVSGGMWRSEDKGATWTRTSAPSDLKSVTCLVQDTRPGKTNIWYYGTGEARANSAGFKTEYHGDGIYRSTDGGRSWKPLDATISRTPHLRDDLDYIMNLAVDPSNLGEDEIYAATTKTVYRSTDGGLNWEMVLGSPSGWNNYCEVAVSQSGVVYASIFASSTAGGIYRSTDGRNFEDINPKDFGIVWERVVIAIAPSDENQVYFYLVANSNANHLLKYTHIDGGIWEDRSPNLPADLQSYASYCMVLKVRPDNPNIIFIGGMDLYRSTNGFTSTTTTRKIGGHGYPTQHADQHVLAFVPGKPNTAYSGNDGGVYRTESLNSQSVQWTDCNQGYVTSQFYAVAVDKSAVGSDDLIGGLQDNGTWVSKRGTSNWQNVWGADGGYSGITDRGRMLYASYQNGVVHRLQRNDDGQIVGWTRIDPEMAFGYEFINPFAIDPNDPNYIYIAEDRNIWATTEATSIVNESDGPASNGWRGFPAATNRITALSVSREPADILYYGTSNGNLYILRDASDPSSERENISVGKQLPGGFVSSIAIDPQDANKVLVAYSNYEVISLVYTTNAGETWTPVAGNLEENPDGSGAGPGVKWAATLTNHLGTIHFVGTTTGLYSTTKLDGMNTIWVQEASDMIGNTVVDMIDIRPEDGFVAIATHGMGMYSAFVGASNVEKGERVAESLSLNVTPNPSHEQTRISFNLKQQSPVTITIVDASGKLVYSESTTMPAGPQTLRWNGLDQFNRPLPSGAYTLLIRTPYAEDRRHIIRTK
jgi:photosystem II stability/assembly factor-like uncharacterized protein